MKTSFILIKQKLPMKKLTKLLKLLLLILFFELAISSSLYTKTKTGTISTYMYNIRNLNKGRVYYFLIKKMKRVNIKLNQAFRIKSFIPKKQTHYIKFKNIPYGEYAIVILHDMNHDKKMNTTLIGIPDEDIAISNNVKGGPLGGPKWDDAKINVNKSLIKPAPLKVSHMYD